MVSARNDEGSGQKSPGGKGLKLLAFVAITVLVWWLVRRGSKADITRGGGEELPFPSDLVERGVVLGGYRLCGSGCTSAEDLGGVYRCNDHKDCTDRGCSCHLFSRRDEDSPQDPDSWRHEAGPDKEIREAQGREYRCFCVR